MSKTKSADGLPEGGEEKGRSLAGTQTLVRGLEIIDAVSLRPLGLPELAESIGLTRSTAHRLAGTLVEHRYLNFVRGMGYSLGPRILELGYLTARQTSLPRVAREHLEQLAARTGDTVHLGVLEDGQALYLDKISGNRRVEISSRIGERQPLRSTGLGKALILDASEAQWREYYDLEARQGRGYDVDLQLWLRRMREYAKNGYAFDLEENEDRIRCVAAPVRDVSGRIVGAISVSSAAQYMDDMRMHGLTFEVRRASEAISSELGYNPGVDGAAAEGGKRRRTASTRD
ncbi:IclR family transcriptional regulator [Phenylobacterium sp. SCN 70-31]|uniref:IclR family transcriptional regulator n=1 Tax=Phenylobacterium sp. SCN 70-31 TaxID=1660129 RepID=UPI0008683C13|nr:IclR family transcriptional regulator [Phenylobacterium sp. SCN 70-31]ODT89685.1 MAG: transcriptional regulator [Phenylobacterium sp. SCN 70-31]